MAAVSLRRRLLALVLGATALAWIGVAAVGYFEARHEAEELLDAHLAQFAALLQSTVGESAEEVDTEHVALAHRYARRVAFQVWRRGSALGLHSANAPDERLSASETGFSDARHAGERWRVFSAWDAKRENLVQVGERGEAREEILAALGRNLLVSLAAGLPVLALAVWIAVGGALRPLGALREQLARRRPADREPLEAGGAPAEVAPLVAELNALFHRVHEALERERRLTADAAHELRTPLAALSAHAQVARAAASARVREEALDALVAAAERAARLVEQMLTLARLEAQAPETPRGRLELRALAREALAEAAPGALAKGLEVALQDGAPLACQGYAGLLAVLMRNLADNAVRYTPAGGTVQVTVHAQGPLAVLEFANSGPPIGAGEMRRLGERFHRAGFATETGSGLGLSIVRRIAELHGGEVRIAPGVGGGGLRVTVVLPAAPG